MKCIASEEHNGQAIAGDFFFQPSYNSDESTGTLLEISEVFVAQVSNHRKIRQRSENKFRVGV